MEDKPGKTLAHEWTLFSAEKHNKRRKGERNELGIQRKWDIIEGSSRFQPVGRNTNREVNIR